MSIATGIAIGIASGIASSIVAGDGADEPQLVALDLSNNNGSWTESPDGTWNLTSNQRGASAESLGGDGYVRVDRSDDNRQIVMSVGPTTTLQAYSLETASVYIATANNRYFYDEASTGTVDSGISSIGDLAYRIRREGTALIAERLTSAEEWQTIRSYVVTSSAVLYAKFDSYRGGVGVIPNPLGLGFA